MLNSTFGLNKDYLKYIDKENSYQNNGEDTYNLIFINGATETFKKNGIKKAVINYIELHRESLEIQMKQKKMKVSKMKAIKQVVQKIQK